MIKSRRKPTKKTEFKPDVIHTSDVNAKIAEHVRRILAERGVSDVNRPTATGVQATPVETFESLIQQMSSLYVRLDMIRHRLDANTYRLLGQSSIMRDRPPRQQGKETVGEITKSPRHFIGQVQQGLNMFDRLVSELDENTMLLGDALVSSQGVDGQALASAPTPNRLA